MNTKLVITGGCSFSDHENHDAWMYELEKSCKEKPQNINFINTGMGSQGQELIQKKITLALIESLENYAPEEITVIVMWSGTERKSFFVDNEDWIKETVNGWKLRNEFWGYQFSDLKNRVDRQMAIYKSTDLITYYNKTQGWFNLNYAMSTDDFSQRYLNMSSTLIGGITVSLENIIMLQNTCKSLGINLYQMFYRSYVYDDIVQNKDHTNINYLWKQLNFDSIISKTGLYEYLRPTISNPEKLNLKEILNKLTKIKEADEYSKYFSRDNLHPNNLGYKKWTKEVIVPKLLEKGFFQ